MLILKSSASNGRPSLNDVHIVNLSYVSDVQIKEDVNSPLQPFPSINFQRLNTRLRNQVEDKRRLVAALAAGVSPGGQQLFLTISKTISDVRWHGSNIVVFNSVTIAPPYKLENIKGDVGSKAFIHIKKIVEKYLKDQVVDPATAKNGLSASYV
uniref:AD domain-containing protein n=2 Tax=Timema TaxID=61471 RepID=A0A7R9ARU7_TIMSH|nr:unnamed protein product [Timema shepardi]